MPLESNINKLRAKWCGQLRAISANELSLCPDFPEIARRWEAWWRFEADRPLLVAWAPKCRDIRWDKTFDLLEDPEAYLRVCRRRMESTHYVGEAVPNIRVDIGPVATAAFLGAPLRFAGKENTSWQTPVIRKWCDEAIREPAPDNPWLSTVLTLTKRTAEDAARNYLVSLPDLSGAFDVLANMRGTQDLLLDLYDHQEAILRAADKVVDAWERIFVMLYDVILGQGAGVTTWLFAWGDEPYTAPTCDFNFMIGPEQFKKICLPSLVEQSGRAGRSLFHLDGPGAARHAQAFAEEPSITAMQYTPGAGTPSALAMIDMLRMLQSAGKPLVVCCPVAEVPKLIDGLDYRGLALFPGDVTMPEKADELLEMIEK